MVAGEAIMLKPFSISIANTVKGVNRRAHSVQQPFTFSAHPAVNHSLTQRVPIDFYFTAP